MPTHSCCDRPLDQGRTQPLRQRCSSAAYSLGLKLFGKDWKRIEDFVATRTGTQTRSHAQKYFNRIKKMGPSKQQGMFPHECSRSTLSSRFVTAFHSSTRKEASSSTREPRNTYYSQQQDILSLSPQEYETSTPVSKSTVLPR